MKYPAMPLVMRGSTPESFWTIPARIPSGSVIKVGMLVSNLLPPTLSVTRCFCMSDRTLSATLSLSVGLYSGAVMFSGTTYGWGSVITTGGSSVLENEVVELFEEAVELEDTVDELDDEDDEEELDNRRIRFRGGKRSPGEPELTAVLVVRGTWSEDVLTVVEAGFLQDGGVSTDLDEGKGLSS